MYFPFLTCEVKCGSAALDIADWQNAHSMTIAMREEIELLKLWSTKRSFIGRVLPSKSHKQWSGENTRQLRCSNGWQATFHHHSISQVSHYGTQPHRESLPKTHKECLWIIDANSPLKIMLCHWWFAAWCQFRAFTAGYFFTPKLWGFPAVWR